MKTDRLDPETLAAFLDGKLSPAERDVVVRKLAEGGDDYAAMMEAAELMADSAESAQSRPARRIDPWKWALPLAASIAVVLVLPRVIRGDFPPEIAALQDAAVLETGQRLFRAQERLRVPPMRGSESAVNDGRAFRVGVHNTLLLAAAAVGDTAALRTEARELENLLAEQPGAAPSSVLLRIVDPTESSSTLRAAAEVRELYDRNNWYALGAWTARAVVARSVGNSNAYENTYAARQLLPIADALRSRPGAVERNPEAFAAVDQLLAAMQGRSAETLDTYLDSLKRAAAR